MFSLKSGRAVNLLIVEDSEDHIIFIKKELENQKINCRVQETSNGLDALNVINQTPFELDIVLLDYNLPKGPSGLELLNKIREISTSAQVIVTTGMGSEKIAADAIRLGANNYIIKEGNFAFKVVASTMNAIEKIQLQEELSQKEDELRQSELKYRTAINQANDGIIIIDSQENIAEVNEKILELTGLRSEELIGSKWDQIFFQSDKERISRHFQSGKIVDAEIKQKDSKKIPVEISLKAVELPEGDPFVIMILRDATETKRLEQILRSQTERLESKLIQEKG